MNIIKTDGTRDSVGAYMIEIKEGVYLCDELGNNSWDSYYDAVQVIEEWRKLNG